ncbi:MAG: uroporphyrinogen decarboxylase family protein [Pirellulaceae bacterium]
MNKIERVTAVVEGRQPDRPPVSFWHHFDPDCHAGASAVEAHVRHVETYDLDFLKIMDDNRYPRTATTSGVITDVADLDKLTVLNGDEDRFGRQLELIGELVRHLGGELTMSTTVFNAWTTLRGMTVPESGVHGPPRLEAESVVVKVEIVHGHRPQRVEVEADPRDATMTRFLREAPEALGRALNVISESTGNFTRKCVAAGADGIFLSVRDDWVDAAENGAGTYDRLVRPGDLVILAGADQGRLNMIHVCGKALDFSRFCGYPVQVINWADRYAGPSIQDVISTSTPAICAGLDNLGTMVQGTAKDCAEQVADALAQAGDRPIMIAPGCTFDPQAVPPDNLHAIRRAVEASTN